MVLKKIWGAMVWWAAPAARGDGVTVHAVKLIALIDYSSRCGAAALARSRTDYAGIYEKPSEAEIQSMMPQRRRGSGTNFASS